MVLHLSVEQQKFSMCKFGFFCKHVADSVLTEDLLKILKMEQNSVSTISSSQLEKDRKNKTYSLVIQKMLRSFITHVQSIDLLMRIPILTELLLKIKLQLHELIKYLPLWTTPAQ